jgi:hypothetical protein
MTWRFDFHRRVLKIEHLENSYLLAEVPKSLGKEKNSASDQKYLLRDFSHFTARFFRAGVLRDFNRDLQLTCAGLADFPRARFDLNASEYVFTQIFDARDNKE